MDEHNNGQSLTAGISEEGALSDLACETINGGGGAGEDLLIGGDTVMRSVSAFPSFIGGVRVSVGDIEG